MPGRVSHVDHDGTVVRGVSTSRCPVICPIIPSLFGPTGYENFYLFNDLSARIVRTSVCHRRSCGASMHICSTRAKDTGRHTSAHIYSPCATYTGKQGELDLCRYLHIGIGPAIVHRCPQLLASLENSSAEL